MLKFQVDCAYFQRGEAKKWNKKKNQKNKEKKKKIRVYVALNNRVSTSPMQTQ